METIKCIGRWLVAGLLFSFGLSAQAAPLGLTTTFPDFSLASDLAFTYDANCGTCGANQGMLTITSTIGSYTEELGGVEDAQVTNLSGTQLEAFSLTAILDISTESVVSGSFFIDGVVRDPFPTVLYDGFADPSGHLLSGDLGLFGFVGFGAPSTGGLLEFTFFNAGGLIADLGFTGGGMIFNLTNTSMGAGAFDTNVLTNDWTSTSGSTGDVFVPIPAAVWLFGSGLIALLGFARAKVTK